MAVSFGPKYLGTFPANAESVFVRTLGGASVSTTVTVDDVGRVSFDVEEPGTYRVTIINDSGGGITQTVNLFSGSSGEPSSGSIYDYIDDRIDEIEIIGGGSTTWATIDKPAFVAAGETAADARTAVGAGTSNFSGAYGDLTGTPTIPDTADDIGAVPTTRTVAGKALSSNVTLVKADVGLSNVDNTSDASKPISTATQTALDGKSSTSHTHTASSTTTTSISGITGSDVQAVLAELAVRADAVSVLYSGGAYPTQAGSPPSGVKVRRFYGPVPYAGASWSGVLDTYEYAELV